MEKDIYFDAAFDIEKLLANLPPYIVLDCETNQGKTRYEDIITIGMAWTDNEDCTTIKSVCFHVDRYLPGTERGKEQIRRILAATLFNPSYPGQVIFHNVNFDLPLLLSHFYTDVENYKFRIKDFCQIWDTAALSRTLDNRKFVFHADELGRACHGLKYLVEEYFGVHYGDVVGKGNTREIPIKVLAEYNIEDCVHTLNLFFLLRGIAKSVGTQWDYFANKEMPFILAIVGINWRGVGFDYARSKELANFVLNAAEREGNVLSEGLGRRVNIQSKRELISAFIQNPNLLVLKNGEMVPVSLPFITEKGQSQVDISSFKYMRDQITSTDDISQNTRSILNCLIRCMELWQAFSQIEQLQKHARKLEDGNYRLFARYTVDARTGRVKCGSPSVHGISNEMFSDSEIGPSDHHLHKIRDEFKSVRCLLAVGNKEMQELISIDISGLDLGVMAAALLKYDPDTFWAQCFRKYGGHSPDTHFSILQKVFPEEFIQAFTGYVSQLGSGWSAHKLLDYWVTKEEDGEITFIRRTNNGEIHFLESEWVPKNFRDLNKTIRSGMKTGNLAVSYGQGASDYALGLMDALKRPVSEEEAKERLDRFMSVFPELVFFKDDVMNSVYQDGFIDSPFGRRIYADVWTELNQKQRIATETGTPDLYEFIIYDGGKYWYVKAESWVKASLPLVENLKVRRGKNLLSFKKIHTVFELDAQTFEIKKKPNFSQRTRKSEVNSIEQSKFEKDIFEITSEVDALLSFGAGWEPYTEKLRDTWEKDGLFHLPGAKIVFYRVDLPTPSAKYFHAYRGFSRVAKSFFAIYCQSVAAIVAKVTLNEIQKGLEDRTETGHLVLFPHDQYVSEADKSEEGVVRSIFKASVESDNIGLFPTGEGFGFCGEIEGPSPDFSFNKQNIINKGEKMKNVNKRMDEQELSAWWKSETSKTINEVIEDIEILEETMNGGTISFSFSDPNPMVRHLLAVINSCSNPKTKDAWGLRVGLDTTARVLNIPVAEIEAEIVRRRAGMMRA